MYKQSYMELKLFRTTTISELKKQFNNYFPFLGLDFFSQPHRENERSAIQQKLGDKMRLSETQILQKEGVFSFDASTTVTDFEQRLQTEFGLPV